MGFEQPRSAESVHSYTHTHILVKLLKTEGEEEIPESSQRKMILQKDGNDMNFLSLLIRYDGSQTTMELHL